MHRVTAAPFGCPLYSSIALFREPLAPRFADKGRIRSTAVTIGSSMKRDSLRVAVDLAESIDVQ
jgi:hypothetical protein